MVDLLDSVVDGAPAFLYGGVGDGELVGGKTVGDFVDSEGEQSLLGTGEAKPGRLEFHENGEGITGASGGIGTGKAEQVAFGAGG